jgi:hypothetical protein
VIKFLLKLAVIALLANAAWKVAVVYSAHYRFREAVREAAQYGSALSIDQLRQRVVDIGTEYDVPAGADTFTLSRDGGHTIIDGSYARPVVLVPTFSSYSWPFTWHIDATKPPTLGELLPPK